MIKFGFTAKVTLAVFGRLAAVVVSGCMSFGKYHVDAYNATEGFVDRAKVAFDNGKQFEWGAMNPRISAGMWPMPGSLGRRATVTWVDAQEVQHGQVVDVPQKGKWDSIEFVINADGTVSVKTKQRYESSAPRCEMGR